MITFTQNGSLPIASTFRLNKILNAGKFFSVFSLFFFLLFNTAQAQQAACSFVTIHNVAWVKAPNCADGDRGRGEITVGITGFTGTYTVRVFKILNNALVLQQGLTRTGQTSATQTYTNLGAGYYCFSFTANGCTENIDVPLFCEELGNQGCTPGYWKNHPECWDKWPTQLFPDQRVNSIFMGVPLYGLGTMTLEQALEGGGGSGLEGAAQILLRAAVAALLNAAHEDVDYPRTFASIIADVKAALVSGDRQTMLDLAKALDEDNNLGCPINAHCEAKGEDRSARERTIGIADIAAELSVKARPNPSYGAFNVQIEGGSTDKITMRIMDMQGKLIEQRQNIQPNQVLRIGQTYSPGIYFIEVMQGAKRKQMKLFKSSN